MIRLEDDFFLPIVFAELFGRTIFLLLENTVEVGQVVESALITDFGHGHGRVYQQAAGKTDTDIDDIIRKCLSGTELEETAERGRCHTYQVGHVLQTDFFPVIVIDVFLYLMDASAVERWFYLGERTAGKGFCILCI